MEEARKQRKEEKEMKFNWTCNECNATMSSNVPDDVLRDIMWIHHRNTRHLNCRYWEEKEKD